MDDNAFLFSGKNNLFRIDPDPDPTVVKWFSDLLESSGHHLQLPDYGYPLNFVKNKLLEEGPSYFLRMVHIQEDISVKAPLPTAEEFLSTRLAQLGQTDELIITDPYIFPKRLNDEPVEYVQLVSRLITPILRPRSRVQFITPRGNCAEPIRDAVHSALLAQTPNLTVKITYSSDFHDRFWIADRARGLVIGTSLNSLGRRIFLVDRLNDSDVHDLLELIDEI